MWDRTAIVTFKQSSNSCVLANYALAISSVTNVSIHSFFLAYCEHYQLHVRPCPPGGQQPCIAPECVYAADFAHRSNGQQLGFALIKSLHDQSHTSAFLAARASATVTHVPKASGMLLSIEQQVRMRRSVVCLSGLDGAHAFCCGVDRSGAWYADTRYGQAFGAEWAQGGQIFGSIVDALVIDFV